jgi:hypothetical protein
MADEDKEHGESSPTVEAETSRQKRGKPPKAGEVPKEEGETRAQEEPPPPATKPAKVQGAGEPPEKTGAQTKSKPQSQAERMRFRRRH